MRSVGQDTNFEYFLEKTLNDEFQRNFLFNLENKIKEILKLLNSKSNKYFLYF